MFNILTPFEKLNKCIKKSYSWAGPFISAFRAGRWLALHMKVIVSMHLSHRSADVWITSKGDWTRSVDLDVSESMVSKWPLGRVALPHWPTVCSNITVIHIQISGAGRTLSTGHYSAALDPGYTTCGGRTHRHLHGFKRHNS